WSSSVPHNEGLPLPRSTEVLIPHHEGGTICNESLRPLCSQAHCCWGSAVSQSLTRPGRWRSPSSTARTAETWAAPCPALGTRPTTQAPSSTTGILRLSTRAKSRTTPTTVRPPSTTWPASNSPCTHADDLPRRVHRVEAATTTKTPSSPGTL